MTEKCWPLTNAPKDHVYLFFYNLEVSEKNVRRKQVEVTEVLVGKIKVDRWRDSCAGVSQAGGTEDTAPKLLSYSKVTTTTTDEL